MSFRTFSGLIFSSTLLLSVAQAADVPQSFTLDGRLYSDAAATTALQDASVTFTIQILDDAKLCVIYEESQSIGTLASKGYFSMQVGTEVGSPLRTSGDSANTMSHVFQNVSVINGKLLSNGAPCTVPAVAAKRRYVRIKILPASMGGVARVLSPDLTIDSVPNAIIAERAETLQGLRATNVLQVNTGGTNQLSQVNLESLFTSTARFNSLTAVVDGTSTNYMRSNSSSGAQLPVMSGAPTGPNPGSIWYDTSDSKLKYQTSVGPVIVGEGSGTVTSVGFTAPSELSVAGAPIVSSGTIAVTWATQTANKVFAAPDGSTGTPSFRVMVANDIPNLPWTKITSMLPTTLLGYGITDGIRNAGGTPSIESGLNAAKGAATTAGRVWISTDTREIYRDNGATWDVIGATSLGFTPVNTAGDTMTGLLTLSADPSASLGAATKQYVDSAVATATAGVGDFKKDGSVPMTGTLKMGGNAIYGNSTASGNLTLESTSNATKGYALLQPNGGNVGIGTSAPTNILHVKGGNAEQITIQPTSGWAEISMKDTGGTTRGIFGYDLSDGSLYMEGYGATFLQFLAGGGEVMRITTTGNVGIGTTSPGKRLDVRSPSGDVANFSSAASDTNVYIDNPNSTGNSVLSFQRSGSGVYDIFADAGGLGFYPYVGGFTKIIKFDANGNVGIGTTSPVVTLDMGSKTDGVRMPGGTTAQQPTCNAAVAGTMRYNSQTAFMEYCDGASWNALPKIQPASPPTTPSGGGYFVMSSTTYNGNFGGLTGANAACLTELTTNTNWAGYTDANSRGLLVAAKVKAFLCDTSTCNQAVPLATYAFASVGFPAVGGGTFTADASGIGPNDSTSWAAANRFGSTYQYWSGRWYSTSTQWSGWQMSGRCGGWVNGSVAGDPGSTGNSSSTDHGRWVGTTVTCDTMQNLVCFVNP